MKNISNVYLQETAVAAVYNSYRGTREKMAGQAVVLHKEEYI